MKIKPTSRVFRLLLAVAITHALIAFCGSDFVLYNSYTGALRLSILLAVLFVALAIAARSRAMFASITGLALYIVYIIGLFATNNIRWFTGDSYFVLRFFTLVLVVYAAIVAFRHRSRPESDSLNTM